MDDIEQLFPILHLVVKREVHLVCDKGNGATRTVKHDRELHRIVNNEKEIVCTKDLMKDYNRINISDMVEDERVITVLVDLFCQVSCDKEPSIC